MTIPDDRLRILSDPLFVTTVRAKGDPAAVALALRATATGPRGGG